MRLVSACTLDGYFQTYKHDVFVAECDPFCAMQAAWKVSML